MAGELTQTMEGRNLALNQALENASSIITKDYLEKLDRLPLVCPSWEDLDVDITSCGKFYRLRRLVVNREENFLHKLTTVVNVASSLSATIATIVRSDGERIDYYIGILSKSSQMDNQSDRERREANEAAFRGAVEGNLAGAELEGAETGLLKALLTPRNASYASVSGIVALRDKEGKNPASYVQGLENLTDALRGRKYTLVMLADPLETSEIRRIKQGYEMLATELSTYARSALTLNENDTRSLSETLSTNFTKNISTGISFTQGRSTSHGTNHGWNAGTNLGLSFILSAGVSAGVYSGSFQAQGETSAQGTVTNKGSSYGSGRAKTASDSRSTGRSLQLNHENRAVKTLLDRVDRQLERLDACESFGAFDCAAYVIADTKEAALTVASNYNALLRGEKSCVQASHINAWDKRKDTEILGKYLSAMSHPRFYLDKENKDITVTPASVISGEELAIQVALPKKSVPGMTVIPMVPFGRNIAEKAGRTINLGEIFHMGNAEPGSRVPLSVEDFSMHTFITGSTGSGKSTAIYSILDRLKELPVENGKEKIHFMVVEPAKGEYKNRFGNDADVSVYGTNARKTPLLRLNPFSFPEDVHVLEHIDRLIEIFNVCWPMYAAMPAVLKDAVEQAYVSAGWNLETSVCKWTDSRGNALYPTFADVLREIGRVMDRSAYSADTMGDYKGSLMTRLKSLTNGLYRQIFTSNELSGKELFDENVIVDLSRTGSSETKSLIMGLLVMKLQEYRMAHAGAGNAKLQHVTVLEEAHHLLKRTGHAADGEGSNMLGKSVEMLSNSIAEMRTYGEGFIIADQAPGLLDPSVIRNTNTKIILRLPGETDRELVGKAAGLNDGQVTEIAKLPTFVAAVYQNDWMEPVLCRISTNFKETVPYKPALPESRKDEVYEYIRFLLQPLAKRKTLDRKTLTEFRDGVFRLGASAEAKAELLRFMDETREETSEKLRGKVLYDFFNADTAFEAGREAEKNIEAWERILRETLLPELSGLSELEQCQTLATLLHEHVERMPGASALFADYIGFIDGRRK